MTRWVMRYTEVGFGPLFLCALGHDNEYHEVLKQGSGPLIWCSATRWLVGSYFLMVFPSLKMNPNRGVI